MSKAKLTASEWELVKDAPYWVNQALAAADGRVSLLAGRREGKAFEKAISNYTTNNSLIKDIIADDSDAAKAVKNASQADAEKALNRIAGIVEQKLGADDLAALKDFLLNVGNTVASAAKEGGKNPVSEKEAAALVRIESALKASASLTTAHVAPAAVATAVAAPKPAAASAKPGAASAAPKRDEEAKAKRKEEVQARREKARQEAEEHRNEAREAKAKARAEAQGAKANAKAEAEAAETQARAEAEAAEAQAREEAARKEAEAKAAASAPKYTNFIAEHTVAAGDNLSFISERYYGTQANFRIIYEANKDVIGDNMNLIKPGQVLKIPKL